MIGFKISDVCEVVERGLEEEDAGVPKSMVGYASIGLRLGNVTRGGVGQRRAVISRAFRRCTLGVWNVGVESAVELCISRRRQLRQS